MILNIFTSANVTLLRQKLDTLINRPVTGYAGQLAQSHVPKLARRIPALLALFILEQDFLFGAID